MFTLKISKKMAQVNLGYLKITPKNIFDPKKHFHPFFLYVNLPLRLFKTQIKTFHIFSQKLLIAPLVHHCVGLARHCAEEERLLPLQVPRAAAGLVLEAGLLWGGEYYDSSLYYLPFCYKYYAQFCDSVFRI